MPLSCFPGHHIYVKHDMVMIDEYHGEFPRFGRRLDDQSLIILIGDSEYLDLSGNRLLPELSMPGQGTRDFFYHHCILQQKRFATSIHESSFVSFNGRPGLLFAKGRTPKPHGEELGYSIGQGDLVYGDQSHGSKIECGLRQ